jgi:hypothetical protein
MDLPRPVDVRTGSLRPDLVSFDLDEPARAVVPLVSLLDVVVRIRGDAHGVRALCALPVRR